MQKRQLGRSGLHVSTLVLGGNVFGWTIDQPAAFAVLDAYVAAGGNCLDTADGYSIWVPGNQGGESETIIGAWMKSRGNRDRIVVATKVGWELSPTKKGLSRSYILQAVEGSLTRLQTDYIDLYQSHRDDPATTPEETLEAYSELVRAGKVRVIGASNFGADRLAASLEVSRERGYPRYESLQPLYNLYDRADFETTLEPVCAPAGLGVIPYSSLASGFLTGKYRSERDLSASTRGQNVGKKYLNDRGLRIIAALDQVARDHHTTLATVAVAWLIGRPSVTAAIASATTVHQLDDLVAATALRLDGGAVDRLDHASAYAQETAASAASA
jgi:aryl-alcohol dehydrogenase-like predicted oxidoreductase